MFSLLVYSGSQNPEDKLGVYGEVYGEFPARKKVGMPLVLSYRKNTSQIIFGHLEGVMMDEERVLLWAVSSSVPFLRTFPT